MGRYDLDLREIVKLNMTLFSFFGIIPPKLRSTKAKAFFFIRVLTLTGLLYCGVVLSQIGIMYMGYRYGSIKEMVSLTNVNIANILTVIKLWCIFKNRNRIDHMIENINRRVFQPRSENQHDIMKKYIRLSKTLTIILIGASNATCLFLVMHSFSAEGGPFLPLNVYIPYNIEHSPTFEITYICETLGTFISAFFCMNADSTIAALMMVVCAELTMLNDSLENIREQSEIELGKEHIDVTPEQRQELLHRKMNEKLTDCVHQHKEIMK
ncbi:hypothetical protein JTB14_015974 [Gonioctena quinquepunctata]|nr:hypothetical protein JTB14_015974 [Gonioctena quinquepunctata]